jgi:hypothetical protein
MNPSLGFAGHPNSMSCVKKCFFRSKLQNTKLKKNERNIPVTRFITEVTNNPLLQEMIENSREERHKRGELIASC